MRSTKRKLFKRPCFLIKQKFFEQIISGEKKIEYRDNTARNRMALMGASEITLLCGRKVVRFEILSTKVCWGKIAIRLGKIVGRRRLSFPAE